MVRSGLRQAGRAGHARDCRQQRLVLTDHADATRSPASTSSPGRRPVEPPRRPAFPPTLCGGVLPVHTPASERRRDDHQRGYGGTHFALPHGVPLTVGGDSEFHTTVFPQSDQPVDDVATRGCLTVGRQPHHLVLVIVRVKPLYPRTIMRVSSFARLRPDEPPNGRGNLHARRVTPVPVFGETSAPPVESDQRGDRQRRPRESDLEHKVFVLIHPRRHRQSTCFGPTAHRDRASTPRRTTSGQPPANPLTAEARWGDEDNSTAS